MAEIIPKEKRKKRKYSEFSIGVTQIAVTIFLFILLFAGPLYIKNKYFPSEEQVKSAASKYSDIYYSSENLTFWDRLDKLEKDLTENKFNAVTVIAMSVISGASVFLVMSLQHYYEEMKITSPEL